MLSQLFDPIITLFNWVKSIVESIVTFLRTLPNLVDLIIGWNTFVPSFVFSFFSIGLFLGIVLFILKRK